MFKHFFLVYAEFRDSFFVYLLDFSPVCCFGGIDCIDIRNAFIFGSFLVIKKAHIYSPLLFIPEIPINIIGTPNIVPKDSQI